MKPTLIDNILHDASMAAALSKADDIRDRDGVTGNTFNSAQAAEIAAAVKAALDERVEDVRGLLGIYKQLVTFAEAYL